MNDEARAWWRDEPVLHRFVCVLIASELGRARPTWSPPAVWDASMHLQRDLGVDSIELLPMAMALTEALHLHESGIEDRLLADATIGGWVDTAREGLECYSSAITFRTSGSEGEPKRCTHELSTLLQEVEALAPMFEGRRRVLSAVRAHHIYGFLFTVLLPSMLRMPGECVVDVRGHLPTSLCRELRDGDLVVGHPDFWRAVAGVRAIPPGIVGVTSTAPCDGEVARRLSNAGLDALVEVYGSTETAGVGTRTDPDEPYELLPYWSRTPDDETSLLRRLPDDRLASYPLQDTLHWSSERRFRPTGRIDRMIQVAGVNVSPEHVRRVLMTHPSVLDAIVRRMHPDDTSRLEAFVVPRAGHSEDVALHVELESWVSAHLTAPERPRAFTILASLHS